MLQRFKQPLFWIRLFSILICLVGLMKIFAIIAPATVIRVIIHTEDSNILAELTKSFNLYLDETQKVLGIKSKGEILYLFTFSFLISFFFIISGVFLFLIKSWARKTLIFLIIATILNNFVIMLLRGKFTIKFMAIDDFIFYICLLVFFTRQSVIQLFTEKQKFKKV